MKYLRVAMPDGSKWDVPVSVIAWDRANYYAESVKNTLSFAEALKETNELFDADSYEIEDWAANNMNWDKDRFHAEEVEPTSLTDYQEGWVNGEKEIVEKGGSR